MALDRARLARPPRDGSLTLEPFADDNRDLLGAACAADRDIWSIYSRSWDPDHFGASFDGLRQNPAHMPFAVRLAGEVVGMSAYLGIDPDRQVVELGNTYLRPELRGSGLNPRLKRLMLDHVFACGVRRVEFRVDARNARSQAALAKIGAVREGLLRADRITWTGHVRDTVLFSILHDEWR